MAKCLQLRRGVEQAQNLFTGEQGELTMTTDTNELRIHNGTKVGGFRVPTLVAVQYPSAANNYTWYRKYSDGWVEQGGVCSISQDTATTVILPVSMQNTTYHILITARKDGSTQTSGDGNFTADPIDASSFYWRNGDDFTGYGYWEVKGLAA